MNTYAETMQGLANFFAKQPCEDSAAVRESNGVYVAVVCDGASCCKEGGAIAAVLADKAADALAAQFPQLANLPDHLIRKALLRLIRGAQQDVVRELSCSALDCGCTLVGIVADKTGRWLALKLGDGSVMAQREADGSVIQLLRPDKGQSAHATWLTIHADEVILQHLQVLRGKGKFNAFCVTSDGLEELLYRTDGAVSEDMRGLFYLARSNPPEIMTVLKDSVYRPDDDVSIALITSTQEISPQPFMLRGDLY